MLKSIWQLIQLLFLLLFNRAQFRAAMSELGAAVKLNNALEPILKSYRVGDYQESLRLTEALKDIGDDDAAYYCFKGMNQMYLGQLLEAEQHLLKSINCRQNDQALAIAYSILGQILLRQSRFEDARNKFENSLKLWPNHGPFLRDLSETALLTDQPAEALQLATQAVEHDRNDPPLNEETYAANLAESLATLAWATAASQSLPSAVDRLATESLAFASGQSVGTRSQVHFQIGLAYALLGDDSQSQTHFEKATELDPIGIWGVKARLHSGATQ
jgi:tetratricopeptide (TPR) repeat protein